VVRLDGCVRVFECAVAATSGSGFAQLINGLGNVKSQTLTSLAFLLGGLYDAWISECRQRGTSG
jgi:hypothetical protein